MPDENIPDLTKNPAFAQLAGVVTQLGKGFQTLQGLLANQGSNIEKLVKSMGENSGKPNGKPPVEDKPTTDKEIDEMSQSQLAAHMFKSLRGMLDGFGKDINTKIDGLSTSFEKKNLMSEVDQVKEKHKDFDDWIPEIKEKMTANPGLAIAEAYLLVRSANPDKGKQMDDKYKTGLEDKTDTGKQAFGGLFPTSGGSRSADTDDDGNKKPLTAAEAGDKAWDEVFGDNPNLAGPDSED